MAVTEQDRIVLDGDAKVLASEAMDNDPEFRKALQEGRLLEIVDTLTVTYDALVKIRAGILTAPAPHVGPQGPLKFYLELLPKIERKLEQIRMAMAALPTYDGSNSAAES